MSLIEHFKKTGRTLSIGSLPALIVALACDSSARPAVIAPGPIDGVTDAGGGTRGFQSRCVSPLSMDLASDSPVLAAINSADFDPRYGVLLTDPIEKRVFRFSARGKLIRTFGQPGDGRGEFRDLVDAVFLRGGEVVALDGGDGLTLFDSTGSEVRTPVGLSFSGGTTLAEVRDQLLMVGLGKTILQAGAASNKVSVVGIGSASIISRFAPESLSEIQNFRVFRGVRIAADPSGSLIAVSVPYRLGVEFFRPDGQQVSSWTGVSPGYRQPSPHPDPFGSRDEADGWVLSSSYLLGISAVDSNRVLIFWNSYLHKRRHYYAALYSRLENQLLSLDEIPYRFLRGRREALLFLDTKSRSVFHLIICRGWAATIDRHQAPGYRRVKVSPVWSDDEQRNPICAGHSRSHGGARGARAAKRPPPARTPAGGQAGRPETSLECGLAACLLRCWSDGSPQSERSRAVGA